MLFEGNRYFILSIILYIAAYSITVFKINRQAVAKNARPSTQAKYHGYIVVLAALMASCIMVIFCKFIPVFAHSQSIEIFLVTSTITLLLAALYIKPATKAREKFESFNAAFYSAICKATIAFTAIIIFIIFFNSWRFFAEIPIHKFLFGTYWNPQSAALAENQADSFGLLPLLCGTLLITLIALLIAVPFGLASAIYITEFSGHKFRVITKSSMELLAGIPTVVYGYFAAIFIGPAIRNLGEKFALDVGSESALSAGIVMGIMIMPYIMTLTDDVIGAVPKSMRDGAIALGLTRSEAIINIVLPIAWPGILASVLLAISRAIGETMIVTMGAGLFANMTLNPLDSVTTITVQIVRLLSGDQEFGSVTTSSAFALALALFILTFLLNLVASMIVAKYRRAS